MQPKVSIYPDYHAMSRAAADVVIELLHRKPTAVICLPSGSSPEGMFHVLAEAHRAGTVDFSSCTYIGLDEWVGLGAEDYGSCRELLDRDFLKPIGFRNDQIIFFDGLADDPEAECVRVNHAVGLAGGLDLIVLGVGMNGHLALNEPGTSFDTYAHVSDLDPVTVAVGQKYFKKATPLTKGITVGIRHILEAKKALLLASGGSKAGVVQKALTEEISNAFPVTVLREHHDAEFIIDADAASLLDDTLDPR